jgi:magnesium transporter
VGLRVTDYGPDGVDERDLDGAEDARPYRDAPGVSWVDVTGVHDGGMVEEIGSAFGLHPLVLEDVVNTHQRPKLEDYEDYVYMVVKMLTATESGTVEEEQVSIVLGPGWVISFQERPGDVFDPVRERIRTGKGRIREMGPDYLAYALLDALVDHYFVVLERLGDRVERVEEDVVRDPREETVGRIHRLKREILLFRKAAWPLREVTSALHREDTSQVTERVGVFVRDVYDHTVQVIDTAETLRDLVAGMLDTYLTGVSNRMNEVMKVLTVMASIFIPLTFVAGVYGMNFEHMPELGRPWAYPAVLSLMGLVAGGMVVYFRRRGWI